MKNLCTVVILVLIAVCVQSCSTGKPVKRTDCMLFPLGTYKQNISVSFGDKSFSFRGVLKKAGDSVTVYALSMFGTTLFRIQSDKGGSVKADIYNEDIKAHKDKLLVMYNMISGILDIELCEVPDRNFVLKKHMDKYKVEVSFDEFDQNRIPGRTKIVHDKYLVEIGVSGYEI
jgi:hypothetical protein